MKQPPVFWNRDEKALIVVSALVVILGITFIQFLRHRDDLPTVAIPTPTLPSPNAFDFFTKAGLGVRDGAKIGYAISDSHPSSPYGPDDRPYSQAEKEALVSENAAALATLRRGFAYPYVNPPARSFSALFSYYAKERGLARLLTLEGQARAGRGDWNEAVGSSLDAVQVGAMVPHGGVLIGSLVGIACEAIGRRPIWNTYRHLNAAQARAAACRLETLSGREVTFADTMQEEKWLGQAGLLEILRAPDWSKELASVSGVSPIGLVEARLQFTPKRRIIDDYTGYMDAAIASASRPYAAAPSLPPVPGDPISHMMIKDFSEARFRATDNQTQDALLTAALALHAYRLERGAYPTTLTALVPGCLKAVPGDPFAASGPLHYRQTGGTYVLYSVGPDGKDDGGTAILDTSIPAPAHPGERDRRRYPEADSKGDIVAGVNE